MVLGSSSYQTNFGATTTTTTPAAAGFRSGVVAAVAAARRARRRRTPSRRRAAEPSSQSKTEKDDDAVTRLKCVILPGFLRGFESYEELRENVEKVMEEFKETVKKKEGSGNAGVAIEVSVAKVTKDMWIPVTFRGESLRNILDAIEDEVCGTDDVRNERTKVVLIGHSAGGWIARLFLGGKAVTYDGKMYDCIERANVVALVTLGTPHNSAEAYPFGRVKEQRTREKSNDDEETSLQETRRLYPNCFHADSGMKYVTVQGTGFKGRPFKLDDFFLSFTSNPSSSSQSNNWKTLFEEIKHGISYKTDCLDPSSDGDSVTCVSSGLGLGPEAIEVRIEGVKHEKDDIHPWYGSLDVVRTWMNPVLEML